MDEDLRSNWDHSKSMTMPNRNRLLFMALLRDITNTLVFLSLLSTAVWLGFILYSKSILLKVVVGGAFLSVLVCLIWSCFYIVAMPPAIRRQVPWCPVIRLLPYIDHWDTGIVTNSRNQNQQQRVDDATIRGVDMPIAASRSAEFWFSVTFWEMLRTNAFIVSFWKQIPGHERQRICGKYVCQPWDGKREWLTRH